MKETHRKLRAAPQSVIVNELELASMLGPETQWHRLILTG